MKQNNIKAFVCGIILTAHFVVGAESFNQYIGVGDSTMDTGYFRYNSTGVPGLDPLIAAAVANGDTGAWVANGTMNSTILAKKFGLTAFPVGFPGGGTNYANGGSFTMITNLPMPGNVSAIQQIQNYLTTVKNTANAKALYVIKTGDNDILNSDNVPLPPNILSDSAAALAKKTAVLQAAGARTIMFPNSYAYAVVAGPGGNIDPIYADVYTASVRYGLLRWSNLHYAGVHFIPADLDSLFKYIAQHPTKFGFTASSVLGANGPAVNNPYPYNSALLTPPLTQQQQQTFLFIDNKHLTTAGQTIEADYEYSLLVAPSQISLAVESTIQKGFSSMATFQRQIEQSWAPRTTRRVNFWTNIEAEYLRIKNDHGFPHVSGIPFGGTIGLDYQAPFGALFGIVFTAGFQKQKFSQNGGYFNQIVEAPSLYAAYKNGPIWGEMVATYSALQHKIKRRVQLGRFIDENTAKPNGSCLALMGCLGGDFKINKITTGPVIDVMLQQAHLHRFTESGDSGVTALSFASQTKNSIVSQIGWRILGNLGKWQPFAQARWNHEWGNRKKMVTTALTSVGAPSYSMAATPVASDWADAWLGSTYQVTSQVKLQGNVSAMIFNRRVINYGGQLGVNVNF